MGSPCWTMANAHRNTFGGGGSPPTFRGLSPQSRSPPFPSCPTPTAFVTDCHRAKPSPIKSPSQLLPTRRSGPPAPPTGLLTIFRAVG